MQSLWTGLTGMSSASNWLNQVSDNLANTNTVGFASDEGSFADAFTTALQGSATAPSVSGRYTPLGWWGGTGVMNVSAGKDFTQMPMTTTNNPLDASIAGTGFFAVGSPSGVLLTKAGNFTWSKQADGTFALALPNGMPVLDENGQHIIQPQDYSGMSIGDNGQIMYGTNTGPKLSMLEVQNPSEGLQPVSDNLFAVKNGYQTFQSTNSTVHQGSLSMSNVNLTQQMTDMIQAQHMFGLNSESISLTNRMMGIANQLRG